MKVKENRLIETIGFWYTELKRYDFDQFVRKPSPNNWSIGQVYNHLADQTSWYFSQAAICLSSNDNINGEPSDDGKKMLLDNEFPDEIIEGPASNVLTAQPESKSEIEGQWQNISKKATGLMSAIGENPASGKTRHPGLGFFSAQEWLQFADMHLRHHLRQKSRIDRFLFGNKHI